MNVDAQFPPASFAGTPHRPAQRPEDQTTTRPVDRPHHDEPAGKQTSQESEQVAERKPVDQQTSTDKTPSRETELSPDGKRDVEQLQARAEMARQEDNESTATNTAPARGGFDTNPTQPASVGELLDVVA